MHYTTVTVGLVEGHETEGINDAIKQATQELADETGGLVELVNIVPIPLPDGKLCITVMAKPYEPPMPVVAAQAVVNDIMLRERFRSRQ